MNDNYSKSIRQDNEEMAFDPDEWEFKAKQFFSSAEFLVKSFDERLENHGFQSMMFLPNAEFLLSFSIELISKAYYLQSRLGPREKIYNHNVQELFKKDDFSKQHWELLAHTMRYVVWAGRYPTPKWTKEKFKKESDVPSIIKNGIESINAIDIPSTSSRPRVDLLFTLYNHIRNLWIEAKN